MVGDANLIEEAMELTNDGVDLLRQVTGIHHGVDEQASLLEVVFGGVILLSMRLRMCVYVCGASIGREGGLYKRATFGEREREVMCGCDVDIWSSSGEIGMNH